MCGLRSGVPVWRQSEIPPVGIPWPALRGPLWNHNWKRGVPSRPGENSGNALEASNALNYRVWGSQPYSWGEFQETLWERFRGLSRILPEFLSERPSRPGGINTVWPRKAATPHACSFLEPGLMQQPLLTCMGRAARSRGFEIGGLEGHCLTVLAGRNVSIIRALSTDICIPRFTSQVSRLQRVVFVINLGVHHSWFTWFHAEILCGNDMHEVSTPRPPLIQAFLYRVSVWR